MKTRNFLINQRLSKIISLKQKFLEISFKKKHKINADLKRQGIDHPILLSFGLFHFHYMYRYRQIKSNLDLKSLPLNPLTLMFHFCLLIKYFQINTSFPFFFLLNLILHNCCLKNCKICCPWPQAMKCHSTGNISEHLYMYTQWEVRPL